VPTDPPTLIIQAPGGGALQRNIERQGPDRDKIVVEFGPTDAAGDLEPPDAGEVVMSVPSPETLTREGDELRRVIARAGTGAEPLVLVVEAAEEIRDEELAPVLDAASRASRPVILRIIRNA
jgi:hypothetical protein